MAVNVTMRNEALQMSITANFYALYLKSAQKKEAKLCQNVFVEVSS